MTHSLFSIQAGYIPLNDAAILIVAKECGFAEQEGIDLQLKKETSWATLRDKLAIGLFDVAHILASIPVAASCNLFPLPLDVVVPMALGLGGNMITLSRSVWEQHLGPTDTTDFDAASAGRNLARLIRARQDAGLGRLKFGAVHPYSSHNYELRYWLSGSGIDPDRDVEILFLPPSTMPEALKSGLIDGYCVGEPWNSQAILEGEGVLLTTKAHIWQSSPEKVLAVRRSFARDQEAAHFALLRALYNAAVWIEDADNLSRLCEILSRDEYLGLEKECLLAGFSGKIRTGFDHVPTIDVPDFYLSVSRAALFPWNSHALWFYSQMVRWEHVSYSENLIESVRKTFSPDYLRRALAGFDVPLPIEGEKVEGAFAEPTPIAADKGQILLGPDQFFDGRTFDPEQISAYLDRG
nr:CmpA/NrtA family ABC transporter substrate-binding protein [uncultured Cohaesibacter sp.]